MQIAEIVQLPDFKATLDKLSFQPVGSTPAQFAAQIKNNIVVWSRVSWSGAEYRGLEQSDEGRQYPGQLTRD